MTLEDSQAYFQFLANMGLTKHIGSMQATRELLDLCHIGREAGQVVLDVGCGVDATPVYLAKRYDVRVVAVDLLAEMVRQARARAKYAKEEKVAERIAFTAADARVLPFEDGVFDAVITESVNVFFNDKEQAIREYARVTKPGGYVGLTEMTWMTTPSPEAEEWETLLKRAGLQEVIGHAHEVDMTTEGRGRIERYGCRGFLRVLGNFFVMILKDHASRAFLGDVMTTIPKDIMKDMGYGIYVGRKGSAQGCWGLLSHRHLQARFTFTSGSIQIEKIADLSIRSFAHSLTR